LPFTEKETTVQHHMHTYHQQQDYATEVQPEEYYNYILQAKPGTSTIVTEYIATLEATNASLEAKVKELVLLI
jgi:hypothetical protein